MATYKVLGQSSPAATTNTDVYTVPGSTQSAVSTIAVCNRSASSVTYRLALRPAGAAIANQHYLAYDANLPANTTVNETIGVTLATTDVVTVYASSTSLTFQVFGVENP